MELLLKRPGTTLLGHQTFAKGTHRSLNEWCKISQRFKICFWARGKGAQRWNCLQWINVHGTAKMKGRKRAAMGSNKPALHLLGNMLENTLQRGQTWSFDWLLSFLCASPPLRLITCLQNPTRSTQGSKWVPPCETILVSPQLVAWSRFMRNARAEMGKAKQKKICQQLSVAAKALH